EGGARRTASTGRTVADAVDGGGDQADHRTTRAGDASRHPLYGGWGADAAEEPRSMWTILLIILILLAVGSLPTWPYSTGCGYYPSGGLGLILVIVIILALLGRA